MEDENLDSLLFPDMSQSPQSSQRSLPRFVCLQIACNIGINTEAWHNTPVSFTSEVGLNCQIGTVVNWACMALPVHSLLNSWLRSRASCKALIVNFELPSNSLIAALGKKRPQVCSPGTCKMWGQLLSQEQETSNFWIQSTHQAKHLEQAIESKRILHALVNQKMLITWWQWLACSITHQTNMMSCITSQCKHRHWKRQQGIHHKGTYRGDASREEVCCGSNANGHKPLKWRPINGIVVGKRQTLLHCS